MHAREGRKTTATGPLAVAMLAGSELRVHGDRDERVDLNDLFDADRRVLLLYPREDAEILCAELLARDERPVTLVVPDGSWRQAARAARRIPGMERAETVVLPQGRETEWGVRHEPKEGGLATLEAIARAFGILESRETQQALERVFATVVRETLDARGSRDDDESASEPGEDEPSLTILFEDPFLVFVDKPSGMLVHRGWGDDERPVLQRLRDQLGVRVHPIHRLDRATSGVLAFAKSPEDARRVQIELESGRVEKRYLALCRGHDPNLGRVDHPIASEDDDERRDAVTDFRLLASSGRYGLVEAYPRTGRPHQIRKHLKHVSHPIIGDVRYGKGEHNRHFRETHDFHRLALHAESLSMRHPRTGEPLVVRAPLPADFARVLAALGMRV